MRKTHINSVLRYEIKDGFGRVETWNWIIIFWMDTNSTVNNSENRILSKILTKYDVKTAKIYHVALTSQSNN